MKKLCFLICILSLVLGCNKGTDLMQDYKIEYTINVSQTQCSNGENAYEKVFIDIIDPVNGSVTGSYIQGLTGTGELKFSMGSNSFPHYCGTQCSDSERIHFKIDKTYEWKAYLVCGCGDCGSDFYQLNLTDGSTSAGTNKPVKVIGSGNFTVNKKEKKNITSISISY